ncbi:hypothetical protein AC629_12790 [Bradyrhizobium sp. NAS80.1]|uniref:hypothetical protein n=1 Tax=Bradyrhizobium sp. NAS80.1 TaxID=1680159 RepID=UPI0009604F14|nr:hypothetical protein [Bradyrhizobium sp. NAS80.1]OKO87768.1 hypothetical protein AC629_12790 [Bradyrhizobium sp. NAS80.1]
MLKWLIRRQLAAFERKFDFNADYLRDILDADLGALRAINKTAAIAQYQRDIPVVAWAAAGITATMHEDCGPCTQLGVTLAKERGVDPTVLRAIVSGDEKAMSDDARLAYRFAKATLAHDAVADDFRAMVESRWGKRAVVALAFAVAAGRIYPTVKYALGHGKACSRITVDGTVLSPVGSLVA